MSPRPPTPQSILCLLNWKNENRIEKLYVLYLGSSKLKVADDSLQTACEVLACLLPSAHTHTKKSTNDLLPATKNRHCLLCWLCILIHKFTRKLWMSRRRCLYALNSHRQSFVVTGAVRSASTLKIHLITSLNRVCRHKILFPGSLAKCFARK